MKRWFPESGEMGKQHEPKTIRVGQLRSLDLPIQNDQLLAQPVLSSVGYVLEAREEVCPSGCAGFGYEISGNSMIPLRQLVLPPKFGRMTEVASTGAHYDGFASLFGCSRLIG